MSSKIYVNLPVTDLRRSIAFYMAMGFSQNLQFSDDTARAALASGGSEPRPATDLGFMYNRTIADPDGHRWEPFFMNMAAMPQQQ